MKEKKELFWKKAGVLSGLTIGVTAIIIISMAWSSVPPEAVVKDDGTWHVVQVLRPNEDGQLVPLGDNDPGAGASGWIEFFCLDYAQVPETVLQNNATDWSSSANARGWTDSDDWNMDLKSEDPFFFVCGARFNATHCKDAGTWNESRWRIRLTVSGDETITTVYEYNDSGTDGDGVTSSKDANYMYVYAWWDDGVDGYRITDDGTLTISEIRIEAKY